MHRHKPICGPGLQLLRAAVSVPAPLNANELRLSMPTYLLHAPLRERMLAVACTNVMVDVYMYRCRSTEPV